MFLSQHRPGKAEHTLIGLLDWIQTLGAFEQDKATRRALECDWSDSSVTTNGRVQQTQLCGADP